MEGSDLPTGEQPSESELDKMRDIHIAPRIAAGDRLCCFRWHQRCVRMTYLLNNPSTSLADATGPVFHGSLIAVAGLYDLADLAGSADPTNCLRRRLAALRHCFDVEYLRLHLPDNVFHELVWLFVLAASVERLVKRKNATEQWERENPMSALVLYRGHA